MEGQYAEACDRRKNMQVEDQGPIPQLQQNKRAQPTRKHRWWQVRILRAAHTRVRSLLKSWRQGRFRRPKHTGKPVRGIQSNDCNMYMIVSVCAESWGSIITSGSWKGVGGTNGSTRSDFGEEQRRAGGNAAAWSPVECETIQQTRLFREKNVARKMPGMTKLS